MAVQILIIDDQRLELETVQLALQKRGYRVHIALSGEAALKRCESLTPDVIVIDLLMPGMDGLQTIAEFRLRNTTAKIIAVSGMGGMDRYSLLAIAAKMGANRAIPKPILANELEILIAEMLSTKGAD